MTLVSHEQAGRASSLNSCLASIAPLQNYGYLFWGLNSIATAYSLAEIAAKYPTAGAYYHYAYTLAPPRYAGALLALWRVSSR